VAVPRVRRGAPFGLLRAELVKITHLRITWVMMALYALAIIILQLIWAAGQSTAHQLRDDAFGTMLLFMEGDLSALRVFSGIFILVLAAHVIGLEYQHGTIHIVLGRGVSRLRWLGAKALALGLTALAFLALGLAIEVTLGAVVNRTLGGSQVFSRLPVEYWRDMGIYLLCVLISMGVTLALGIAVSVLGRSLAVGLTVGLCWFAVDNTGLIVMSLGYRFTHDSFWRAITGYFLGPLLNRLPDYLVPARQIVTVGAHGVVSVPVPVGGFGAMPFVTVSGSHALTVIAVYTAVFVALAVILRAQRDVRE
jgi:ABC-type transport system involved in multi-copper enzyme maturation permease subunit